MEKVSNMTFSELVSFYHMQLARVEQTWFRIMYLHAAIVGVLVFFFEAEDTLLIQRALVFGFYTVNMLIFHFALQEGYAGLKAVVSDLSEFPDVHGEVAPWLSQRRFDYKSPVRITVLAIAWFFVAVFLFLAGKVL